MRMREERKNGMRGKLRRHQIRMGAPLKCDGRRKRASKKEETASDEKLEKVEKLTKMEFTHDKRC